MQRLLENSHFAKFTNFDSQKKIKMFLSGKSIPAETNKLSHMHYYTFETNFEFSLTLIFLYWGFYFLQNILRIWFICKNYKIIIMINNKISKISSRKLSLATTLYISLLLFFFDIVDVFNIDTNFQICHDCACKTFLNFT